MHIVAAARRHAVKASSGGYVQSPDSKERRNKPPGVSRGSRRKGENNRAKMRQKDFFSRGEATAEEHRKEG